MAEPHLLSPSSALVLFYHRRCSINKHAPRALDVACLWLCPGEPKTPGKMRAYRCGHRGPENQDSNDLPAWSGRDLSLQGWGKSLGPGRAGPPGGALTAASPRLGPAAGLPPEASLCARAGPGAALRGEQALTPSRGFSFWRELPPFRICTTNWRDVRRQQRPPVRRPRPGPGPRPAPGSHTLPLAVSAVARVPPRRRGRAQGGPRAPGLGGDRAVGLRGRDRPGELGGGDRPRPLPPDPPSVPGTHQLGPT